MTPDTIAKLDQMFIECPIMRAKHIPTVEEVDAASQVVGVPFSDDYREFLLRYGGAMVGPYPIYGLREVEVMEGGRWSVIEVTKEVRQLGVPEFADWFIFSEDHAGNPIGIDINGTVWIYDHDFGEIAELVSDFEAYIRKQCFKIHL